MRLTARGRYGARVLLDLALHSEWQPIALREIAESAVLTFAASAECPVERNSFRDNTVGVLQGGGLPGARRETTSWPSSDGFRTRVR